MQRYPFILAVAIVAETAVISGCSLLIEPGTNAATDGAPDADVGNTCALGPFDSFDASRLDLDGLLNGDAVHPSLTDDEQTLFFENRRGGEIYLYRVDGFDPGDDNHDAVPAGPAVNTVVGPSLSPDGSSLIYSSWDNTLLGFVPRTADLRAPSYNQALGEPVDTFLRETYVGPNDGGFLARSGGVMVFQNLSTAEMFELTCTASTCNPSFITWGVAPFLRDDGDLLVYQHDDGIYAQVRDGAKFSDVPVSLWSYNEPLPVLTSPWLSRNRCVLYFADEHDGQLHIYRAEKPVPDDA